MPVLALLTPVLPLAGLDKATEARVTARLLVLILALLTPMLRWLLAGLNRAAEHMWGRSY